MKRNPYAESVVGHLTAIVYVSQIFIQLFCIANVLTFSNFFVVQITFVANVFTDTKIDINQGHIRFASYNRTLQF